MKRILAASVGLFVTVTSFAQGTVNFANASSAVGGAWINPGADRYVRWGPGIQLLYPNLTPGDLVASNSANYDLSSLRAALYYGASTDLDIYDFVAASGGTATLRSSTSANVGTWFGHYDTLDTIPPGTTANLVVFVWDTSVSAVPWLAGAANGLFGQSAIFQYTPPTNPLPMPSDFLPQNMGPTIMGYVSEPETFALAGLGAAALLFFRRKTLP